MSSEVDLSVFPNPALDDVSVRYAFSDPPSTPLVLFDTLGRRVRQLHSMETGVGIHDLQIDASNLAPRVLMRCAWKPILKQLRNSWWLAGRG